MLPQCNLNWITQKSILRYIKRYASRFAAIKITQGPRKVRQYRIYVGLSYFFQESPGEPEDVRGSLHVTLTYDPIAGILTVRVVEVSEPIDFVYLFLKFFLRGCSK